MKLFISCRSSLIGFGGLHMHTIISSANSQTLVSSLPNCILLSLFLVSLFQPEPWVLNWIHMGRMSILVFSLILVGLLQVFLHLNCYCLLVCCILFLISSGMGLVFLILILFTWRGVEYCQGVSSIREDATKPQETWGPKIWGGLVVWGWGLEHPLDDG